MVFRLLMLALLMVALPVSLVLAQDTGWVALYKNDTDGTSIAGSKEALLAAIRAGQPIHLAWGASTVRDGQTKSVEHLATPVFITIIDGKEVVVQLPEHIAQRSYWYPDRALFDDNAIMWRGLMSTTGTFDAIWVNRATGEVTRRSPQRAAITWFARQAAPVDTPSLAIPGGVIRDTGRDAERYAKP